jgi:hypothetical protein
VQQSTRTLGVKSDIESPPERKRFRILISENTYLTAEGAENAEN